MVVTSWTREALTYETMVRQGLSSRRPVGVAEAVRSVLALQAQEPAAPYPALWNRIEGFDANDLDRALVDGSIVKASLFRFTLHAVDAGDVPWARAAMQSRVRDAGYHVLEASNADQAIRILEARQDITILFTDIDMPGSMDGLKLAAAVRDRWPPVHIIITTGKVRPLEIPANALFIPKPYVGQAVVAAMRTFENMG